MIIKKVREFILKKVEAQGVQDIPDDAKLIELGILDSFLVVELMTYIEEQFRIKIDVSDLTEENVATLRHIEKFVLEKIKSVE
ncbi:MAG TPA: acyl carrier protein [Candidatus Omnitrophota bacterium]|nr:acyl carrier protein [Candidatus Omnitrophota bacterium]